ncbi:MAG: GGDEF domain-containing protein, partial [Gammaproteobacteria bacterium]
MAPDIPTLMMMVTVAAMVMAATLMAVAWGERSDGIKLWAGALCCLALAYVLFLLRGRIPDPV